MTECTAARRLWMIEKQSGSSVVYAQVDNTTPNESLWAASDKHHQKQRSRAPGSVTMASVSNTKSKSSAQEAPCKLLATFFVLRRQPQLQQRD